MEVRKQNKTIQEQIEKNLQTLKTARDEVRVQAHLFSMDMKRAWNELEPKLESAERAAIHATEASASAVSKALEALIAFQQRTKD